MGYCITVIAVPCPNPEGEASPHSGVIIHSSEDGSHPRQPGACMPVTGPCNLKLGRVLSFLADAFSVRAEEKVGEGRQNHLSPDFDLQDRHRKIKWRRQQYSFSKSVPTGDFLTYSLGVQSLKANSSFSEPKLINKKANPAAGWELSRWRAGLWPPRGLSPLWSWLFRWCVLSIWKQVASFLSELGPTLSFWSKTLAGCLRNTGAQVW